MTLDESYYLYLYVNPSLKILKKDILHLSVARSSPSIEVRTDSIESEKVGRRCRFGQNLPLSERIQPENLFPFTSVQWTPTAAETSD